MGSFFLVEVGFGVGIWIVRWVRYICIIGGLGWEVTVYMGWEGRKRGGKKGVPKTNT